MNTAAAPEQLKSDQYRDARQLDARIALHRRFSTNPQGWPGWLFEQLEGLVAHRAADLLELGCGPGVLWTENARAIPAGWRIRLSDFSPGMLADAEERLDTARHPFSFEVIDAEAIPHAEESFDCVLANHMLYHVPDRPRALAEIRRVLRPGGLLFASTLSGDTMAEMGEVVRAATDRQTFSQMRMAGNFLLENGAEQLNPFFVSVEMRTYHDALEITETEPVLAYYRSMILDEPLTDAELEQIRTHIRERIEREGVFHVRKNGGVFLARKDR